MLLIPHQSKKRARYVNTLPLSSDNQILSEIDISLLRSEDLIQVY